MPKNYSNGMDQERRRELMKQAEISLDHLSGAADDKNAVFRLFNILSNLQNDASRYCKTFDELHLSGAINDFEHEMIGEGLSTFSLACRELAMRIDAIKQTMADSCIENPPSF
jgi:hypothetical protein